MDLRHNALTHWPAETRGRPRLVACRDSEPKLQKFAVHGESREPNRTAIQFEMDLGSTKATPAHTDKVNSTVAVRTRSEDG